MSDNVLRLIPTNPQYVPKIEAQNRARDILASFVPTADQVRVVFTEDVRFVDPGSNLRSITCPVCGNKIDLVWWRQAMTAAYQSGFNELAITLPCCGNISSLNDLRYDWPAGFARFILEAHNPDSDVDEPHLILIAEILQCDLRKIWAHY